MKKTLACVVLIIAFIAPTVRAEGFPFGIRAGFSMEPDQLVIGGHARVAEPLVGWVIQPVLEFGTGNDITTFAISGDFLYTFPEMESYEWSWGAGGGLGWVHYSWDAPAGFDGSGSELGFNLVGQVFKTLANDNRIGLELRIGLGDIPDFKITGSLNFF